MRFLLVLVVALAACLDTPPMGEQVVESSHVEVHEISGIGPKSLDLLLVVDDTAAMVPYQDRIAMLPSIIANAYPSIGGGLLDLHIAVASNDGILRRVHPNGQPFVAIRTEFDLNHTTNFQGTLVEALGQLTRIDTIDPGPSTPLAAVQRVLESDDEGFRRENAGLGILIMTASDDASPGAVLDYSHSFKAIKSDPSSVVITGITAQTTPRLDELFATFTNRSTKVSIDDSDYGPALVYANRLITTILPGMCWPPGLDVDPYTPGIQYEGSVSVTIRGNEHSLPACKLDDEQFCWRLVPSHQGCDSDAIRIEIPPYQFYWFYPSFRAEYVVR